MYVMDYLLNIDRFLSIASTISMGESLIRRFV